VAQNKEYDLTKRKGYDTQEYIFLDFNIGLIFPVIIKNILWSVSNKMIEERISYVIAKTCVLSGRSCPIIDFYKLYVKFTL
jgi:hypothetical protein